MNTIYKTYERFLDAARKFPRWNNTRRRPTTSLGGKLLQSIVEEIGKVEDAIIEYKKDFFIVNYIGREETIVDYLYNAQIGAIDDLDSLVLISPELTVTGDILEFYKDVNSAYYQDGYLVFRNQTDYVEYAYNDFRYKVRAEKFHVWNIFDEFAWWVGLERFKDETNAQLITRTINIFRYKPNSSETGLKNVIYNALSPYGHIDMDEIVFEHPNEDNLNLLNNDGEILYEEISRFNRDIARTKKWDIDYWDNTFRKLGYLPHQWDAEVKNYKDGVGYNNSLYVSTVKDLDTEGKTDVEIFGYKKSSAKVEEYIKNQNLTYDIDLTLTRYNNIINPVQVQYKITASDLTEITNPDNIYIDTYQNSHKETAYTIDELFESKENIDIIAGNNLETDKKYTVRILPNTDSISTFEIENCTLASDEKNQNLLEEKGSFGYNDRGLFVNKKVLLHADTVNDLNVSNNLEDYRYGGFVLTEAMIPGYCEIDVTGFTDSGAQSLVVSSECDLYNIDLNPSYIQTQDFEYTNGSYVSGTSMINPSILTISLLGRDVSFDIAKADTGSLSSGYVDIETYIDGELSLANSRYNVSTASLKTFSLKQYSMHDIVITVKRNTTTPIKISNIRCSRYEVKIETSNGEDISPTTKESVILPRYNGTRYLYITVNNYGQTKPVIKCIHIGATLNNLNSVYTTKIDTTDLTNPRLEFNGNGIIELLDENNEAINYSPNNVYKNNTEEIQGIYLDLSNFKTIEYSEPTIRYASNDKAYIEVNPGQEISSITIYGEAEQLVSRLTLRNALGLETGNKLFTNKNIKGFIIRKNSEETLVKLTDTMCSKKEFSSCKIYDNSGLNMEVAYVSNESKNVESIGEKYNGRFDYVYIYNKDSQDYIAYNTQNIIKNHTENISIVKNFQPAIPSSINVLYYIEDVNTRSSYSFTVLFDNGERWSTSSSRYITIDTNFDLANSGVINTTIKNLNQTFVLSNNIALQDTYIINDEEIELGKYIITPPDYITVIYENISTVQTTDDNGDIVYVEEDGFNKLNHSNIVDIIRVEVDGEEIDSSQYSILGEEGIICWNNSDLIGGVLEVAYTYKKPIYLTFSSLDYLYSIVGYQIETLEQVDTYNDYIVQNCENGTLINVDYSYFTEAPDLVAAVCSNPCYTGIFENDTITVKKIAEDNNVVIHNGYYYIEGDEYWYFADRYERTNDRIDGVKMTNVDKDDSHLIFQQEAVNYLKNSKMICNHMDVHCLVDFNYYRNIPNISSLDHIGACDSFANWHSYNMDINLSQDYDGQTLNFNSKDNNAYAILDITNRIGKGLISCWYNGSLKFALGRERLINDQSLSKTLYVERIEDFILYQDKAYYNTKDLDTEYRYYLIVTGSGSLIEIISSENESIENINSDHEKAISKLGFEISEKIDAGSIIELDFNPTGTNYDGLELTKDWLIQTGSSADWGITKIQDYDLESITKTGFLYRNEALIAQQNDAVILTNPVKLDFKSSTMNVYLKINDYPYNNFQGFNVKVLSSNSVSGEYAEIMSLNNTNQVTVQNSKLNNYIKFEITASENKIIQHLELFAQYRETDSQLLRITDNTYGTLTTKVFDTCVNGDYLLSEIEREETKPESIEYEVRGGRYTDNDIVWTNWYSFNDKHVFNDYRYFQFRVTLKSKEASARIKKFIFEVVE